MASKTDFKKLKQHCAAQSALASRVVDGLLVYLVAEESGLDQEFDQLARRYREPVSRLSGPNLNMLKSQYIGQRIFRKGGLLRRYLNHPALAGISASERGFLEHQLDHPWSFCFVEVQKRHPDHFFRVRDIFRDETFLLYSPGMADTLNTQQVLTWSLLVQNNGSCHQCYGPIVPFASFTEDDLFFFAQEYEPAIASGADLLADFNEHPMAYLMLMAYCNLPRVMNGKAELVYNEAVWEHIVLDGVELPRELQRTEVKKILRLVPADIGKPPHFAAAFYDRSNQLLTLTAMTDEGFKNLSLLFMDAGLTLVPYSDVRLHMSMITAISAILGRSPSINPYESLFKDEKPQSAAEKQDIDKLNAFLQTIQHAWNSGQRDFSVEELARRFELEPATVTSVLNLFQGLPKRP